MPAAMTLAFNRSSMTSAQLTRPWRLTVAAALVVTTFAALPGAWAQPARYQVSASGDEVRDTVTGLVWRRCAEGMTYSATLSSCTGTATTFMHEQALAHARDVASTTGVPWRVPNAKELTSIVDRSRFNPSIDVAAFPDTPPGWFWSSTPYQGGLSAARYVDFYIGSLSAVVRGYGNKVRLVRFGP